MLARAGGGCSRDRVSDRDRDLEGEEEGSRLRGAFDFFVVSGCRRDCWRGGGDRERDRERDRETLGDVDTLRLRLLVVLLAGRRREGGLREADRDLEDDCEVDILRVRWRPRRRSAGLVRSSTARRRGGDGERLSDRDRDLEVVYEE